MKRKEVGISHNKKYFSYNVRKYKKKTSPNQAQIISLICCHCPEVCELYIVSHPHKVINLILTYSPLQVVA